VKTNAEVAAADHFRVIIYFEPDLSHVSLLPLGVTLAEDLVIHGFLGAFPCHDDLNLGHTLVFVGDVQRPHQLHEVLIRGVAC